jgi:hypothetical protein
MSVTDPLELEARIRALANQDRGDRALADLYGDVEDALDYVMDEEGIDAPESVKRRWIGIALSNVDPEAGVDWDVMGNASYDYEEKAHHLRWVALEAISGEIVTTIACTADASHTGLEANVAGVGEFKFTSEDNNADGLVLVDVVDYPDPTKGPFQCRECRAPAEVRRLALSSESGDGP